MIKKVIFLFLVLGLIGLISFFIIQRFFLLKQTTVSEPPKIIEVEGKQKVKYPQDYTIVLVGDSMTEVLGNSDELRKYLKEYYPGKSFEVLNYGFGSTNVLTLPTRLENKTFYTREFRPILDIDFDLIVIESFGHNPLSQYPLEEGLKKQTEALDQSVNLIKKSNPKVKILFVATISPNKRNYGKGQVDLTPEKRAEWANERISYIQNHIRFAKENNIPVANVFERSLNSDGDGNTDYVNKIDYIHPSPTGVYLISEVIAKAIKDTALLD